MVASPSMVREGLSGGSRSLEDIQDWMIDYLATSLEVSPDDIDPTVSFDRYGLDSSLAIGLTGDLEDWLGQEVEPTLLYDYPTVIALAERLSS
ncbi:MAG: acyl carrier protein [Cyanobacteria bacterium J06648_11]